MSDTKPKKEKAKPNEAKAVKEVAASGKPDYGVLKEIVFERTVSVRQYEPLRIQCVYSVGKDDDIQRTLEQIANFSKIVDAQFHPEGTPAEQPPAQPVIQRPPQKDNPQTQFPQPPPQPQQPQNAKFRLPTKFPDESDGEFTSRCIKRAYAIWHNELHEREDMHPKVLGVKDTQTAIEYIKQYGYGGG